MTDLFLIYHSENFKDHYLADKQRRGVVVAWDETPSAAPHLLAEKAEALQASNTNFEYLFEGFK